METWLLTSILILTFKIKHTNLLKNEFENYLLSSYW